MQNATTHTKKRSTVAKPCCERWEASKVMQQKEKSSQDSCMEEDKQDGQKKESDEQLMCEDVMQDQNEIKDILASDKQMEIKFVELEGRVQLHCLELIRPSIEKVNVMYEKFRCVYPCRSIVY